MGGDGVIEEDGDEEEEEDGRWEVGGFYVSARMAAQVEAEGVVRR